MGYMTAYKLTWEPLNDISGIETNIIALGVEDWIKSNDEANYALEPDGSIRESSKWYEHEKHLAELSTQWPNVLFTLHGEGEESADIWRKYFLNGAVQVAAAQILIAEPDIERLKEAQP